jgi:hypothetical protein
MPPTPSAFTIFALASAPVMPKGLSSHSQQDGPMTITVESACTGQARHLVAFIRDAMEYAGTTGAEHASRSLIARAKKEERFLSIRVDRALH